MTIQLVNSLTLILVISLFSTDLYAGLTQQQLEGKKSVERDFKNFTSLISKACKHDKIKMRTKWSLYKDFAEMRFMQRMAMNSQQSISSMEPESQKKVCAKLRYIKMLPGKKAIGFKKGVLLLRGNNRDVSSSSEITDYILKKLNPSLPSVPKAPSKEKIKGLFNKHF